MRQIFLAAALVLTCASAFATEPSDNSIERLLLVTNAQALNDSALQQSAAIIEPVLKKSIDAMNLAPTEKQAAEGIMARFAQKLHAAMAAEMSWEQFKKTMVQIYKDTFSQEEVEALIAFYESPIGKMVREKMPIMIQRYFEFTQERPDPLVQKVQQAAQEMVNEIEAYKKSKN